MTTPPTLRSRLEPFLGFDLSFPGSSNVGAPGFATGVAILCVLVRTPTAAPPTTLASLHTEYSPLPTSSHATRSSAASGMLSNAPLTSAATMYGGRVTGSGPAIGASSPVRLARSPTSPRVFLRFLPASWRWVARHRLMNGPNRRWTSL